jgi:hypothetical protein
VVLISVSLSSQTVCNPPGQGFFPVVKLKRV